MRTLAIAAALLFPFTTADAASVADANRVRGAVVKVFTTAQPPDFRNPWAPGDTDSSTGSGCLIEGRRILTAAHVVADRTFLEVRRHGQAKKYQARVEKVSHEVDLALLRVDDDAFWVGTTPLPFGPLPPVLTEVLVYGFPMGGDTLSITRGVVSRLEHIAYVHSSRLLLGAQVDAAINAGNSGGPALVADRLVGLAMQGIPRAQNLGYLVPVTVIEHFLADAEDGNVDGVPALGVETQDLENPDLRRKYAVPADRTGVLVTATLPGSPTSGALQRGDVLLSIEGHAIANNGTVEFRPSERTSFRYFADIRQVGEGVDLEVLRDGRVQPVHIQLTPWGKRLNLLGSWLYEVPPRYLVFGGLVFAPASRNLANAVDYSEALWALDKKRPGAATEEAVVLVKVLAGVVNEGYHRLAGEVITQVNGVKPKDFADFVRLLEGAEGTFLTLAYEGGDKEIVLDRERARAESGRILARYGVRADRSADLASETGAARAAAGDAGTGSGSVALAQKAER